MFEVKGLRHLVCKLRGIVWVQTSIKIIVCYIGFLHSKSIDFFHGKVNHNTYIKNIENYLIIIALYVGDMLLVKNEKNIIKI